MQDPEVEGPGKGPQKEPSGGTNTYRRLGERRCIILGRCWNIGNEASETFVVLRCSVAHHRYVAAGYVTSTGGSERVKQKLERWSPKDLLGTAARYAV